MDTWRPARSLAPEKQTHLTTTTATTTPISKAETIRTLRTQSETTHERRRQRRQLWPARRLAAFGREERLAARAYTIAYDRRSQQTPCLSRHLVNEVVRQHHLGGNVERHDHDALLPLALYHCLGCFRILTPNARTKQLTTASTACDETRLTQQTRYIMRRTACTGRRQWSTFQMLNSAFGVMLPCTLNAPPMMMMSRVSIMIPGSCFSAS